MGWIQALYETYERCYGDDFFETQEAELLPICHIKAQVHIEVILNGQGNFVKANVLTDKKEQQTRIPCTEKSAGRTSGPVHHPLSDKLKYVAGDFSNYTTEIPKSSQKHPARLFDAYLKDLEAWADSPQSHPKVKAVFDYISKKRLIQDLVEASVLHTNTDSKLLKEWPKESEEEPPPIFSAVSNTQSPEDAMVRWKVQIPGQPDDTTWTDKTLAEAWIEYQASTETEVENSASNNLCLVTGEVAPVATNHPKRIKHGADGAKLISANDLHGFTYRGRFTDGEQACTIGFKASQKAHNALRWLVERQSYRHGNQVVVSWISSGKKVPSPLDSTIDLFDDEQDTPHPSDNEGQGFALRLAKRIAGYKTALGDHELVYILALDSATPGRMAITFYREFKSNEFIERLERWHRDLAWEQDLGKGQRFIGAPSPKHIAEAAYGPEVKEQLKNKTVERLLPCIIDGQPIPQDLVQSTFRRACRRAGKEASEWRKTKGVACSLFIGAHPERKYSMSLDRNRTSRDYLYGRLLAIADHLERSVLDKEKEKNKNDRPSNAERLFERFSNRPASTFHTIEKQLKPYEAKLRNGGMGLLRRYDKERKAVMTSFNPDDFISDKPLSPEFLLGYYCQQQALWEKSSEENTSTQNKEEKQP